MGWGPVEIGGARVPVLVEGTKREAPGMLALPSTAHFLRGIMAGDIFRLLASIVMSFLSSTQKALVDRIGGHVDDIEARMMLGTVGLFAGERQFGVLDNNELYLCVDDDSRPEFVEAGTEPYNAAAVEQATYLEVPDEVVENDDTLASWVERAIKAAD